MIYETFLAISASASSIAFWILGELLEVEFLMTASFRS